MMRPFLLSLLLMHSLASHALAAEAANAERPAPSVTVSTVTRAPIVDTVIVTGTLVAREEIMVAVQVESFAVTEILVEEGDKVKEGQVLARLSRETLDASLAQNTAQIARAQAGIASARSAIAEAEAARVQAQASFQRTRTLRGEGIASAETFDQRQALAQQTAARVTSAREQLNLAEADKALIEAQRRDLEIRLGRTEIKAPVGGIVSRRAARIGAIGSGAGDPMFRLIKDGAVELEADMAETTLARIALGQKATVRPAGHSADIPAKVRLISAEIARSSRLGRVRLALETTDTLVIGSFARGVIELSRKEAVVAPLSAVLFTPDGPRVQVVSNAVVETRAITAGVRAAGKIEILSGLEPGDTVVTISGTFLRQGDRVTPVAAP
jgi:HlyD family secretion protein